jgi:DHA2 family multidrug resistance protein
MSDTAKQSWKPKGNPWLIAVVVTFAAFMEILDTTIVNVSLPHIAGDLSSSYDDATWALTSYLVANGIVLTVSGWLATVLGRKRYFMLSIVGFTIASFLCGIASNLPELIVFRLLQGFCGGGLQPNQQAIVVDTFPPARRSAAFAITTIATVVAPVLGPTLGGYITDNFSWRWVFFINIPVGIIATLAIYALVEDPPWAKKRSKPVDYIGLSLITLGLGSLQIMMDRGEDDNWFGSPFIQIMAVLALIGIVGAIAWLLLARKPVVDLYVFADRNFAVGAVFMGVMGFMIYSTAVLIPQFAQQVLGYSAFLAGLILSPGGIVVIVLIPFVVMAMKFIPTRYIIMTGFVVMGSSFIYCSNLVPNVDYDTLVIMRAGQTAGLAFLFAPLSTIAFASLRQDQNGDASALITMFRNVGGAIGISIGTAMIQQQTQIREAHLSAWMTPLYQPFNALLAQYERTLQGLGRAASSVKQDAMAQIYQVFRVQASVLAYSDVYLVFAIVAFAVVPLGLLFSNRK